MNGMIKSKILRAEKFLQKSLRFNGQDWIHWKTLKAKKK